MRRTDLGDDGIHRRHFLRTVAAGGAAAVGFTALEPSDAFAFTEKELRELEQKLIPLGVSVKAYGALGTGAAGEAKAIQEAINAVSTAGGGVVYFPKGTYSLESTGKYLLNVPSNIALVGAGRGVSILTCTKAIAETTLFFNVAEYTVNVSIEGLTINAGENAYVSEGLNLYFGIGLTVQNTAWENFHHSTEARRAIYTYECSEQRFVDNTFTKCQTAIEIVNPHSEAWVEYNTIKSEGVGTYGIQVAGGSHRPVSIAGNVVSGVEVDKSGVGVEGHGIALFAVQDARVINNSCRECHTSGIHLGAESSGTKLQGNVCYENAGYGIYCELWIHGEGGYTELGSEGRLNGCAIIGNTCYKNGAGLTLSYSPGSTVEGNICYLNNWWGIAADSERISFVGNICYNNFQKPPKAKEIPQLDENWGGMFVYGQRCSFIGNVCYDDQATKTQTYGISTNKTGHLIVGNSLEGNKTGALGEHEGETPNQIEANAPSSINNFVAPAQGVAVITSASEITVTAASCTAKSTVLLQVMGGVAKLTARVKERAAGKFVIELSSSATCEVAWLIYE